MFPFNNYYTSALIKSSTLHNETYYPQKYFLMECICLDFRIHLYILNLYESNKAYFMLCLFWFRIRSYYSLIMQLLTWEFDWKYMVRGLVLDKKRGNILKVSYYFLNLPLVFRNNILIIQCQLVKREQVAGSFIP